MDILINFLFCCGVTLARQHIKILSKLETNNLISVIPSIGEVKVLSIVSVISDLHSVSLSSKSISGLKSESLSSPEAT